MSSIFVKLRLRGNATKYRKMLSTDEDVYCSADMLIESSTVYTPSALLEDGEWFKIENASQQAYAIDVFTIDYDSVDFDSLTRQEFLKTDYLFLVMDNQIYFQNVRKSKLASKKRIGSFGETFQYQNECDEIVINDLPDAIYLKDSDELYFRRLQSIASIFKGIDLLYREATDEETTQFLQNDFICLQEDFSAEKVKTNNRKRIALAVKALSELGDNDRANIYSYIGEYCPNLRTAEDTFSVSNEDDLKLLLFGIEQRFYTTPVGGEKRIANSVIPLS